ncbi:hypothetical protein DPEC_G00051690 [Dallia pectoralis]|uniref:Uncharacterized protein n=1 Tax=Dallia pectoralis TaxID=75939 RepID=A0ACC2HC18_DALPE|nr:hypothetical protein DPEC_G00051690 [Dallia pectoralis]
MPSVSRTIMPRVCVPVSSTLTATLSLRVTNSSSMAAAMAYESHDTKPMPSTISARLRSLLENSMLWLKIRSIKRAFSDCWASQSSHHDCPEPDENNNIMNVSTNTGGWVSSFINCMIEQNQCVTQGNLL